MSEDNIIQFVPKMSPEAIEMLKRVASGPPGPDMTHKSTADYINRQGYWADTAPSEYVAPSDDCA